MTDTYNQLKEELRVNYPDVTDIELNEMTDRLIKFFTIGAQALYKAEKIAIENNTNPINDNSS